MLRYRIFAYEPLFCAQIRQEALDGLPAFTGDKMSIDDYKTPKLRRRWRELMEVICTRVVEVSGAAEPRSMCTLGNSWLHNRSVYVVSSLEESGCGPCFVSCSLRQSYHI